MRIHWFFLATLPNPRATDPQYCHCMSLYKQDGSKFMLLYLQVLAQDKDFLELNQYNEKCLLYSNYRLQRNVLFEASLSGSK